MKKATVLALGLSALTLAACGPKSGTTQPAPGNTAPGNSGSDPVADTGGPKPIGFNAGSGGQTFGAGQTAPIVTLTYNTEIAGLVGTPSVTFKGISGGTLTTFTAPCRLQDARTVACAYPVQAADIGKAKNGVRFDSDTRFSGGVRDAAGKTAPFNLGNTFLGGGGSISVGTKF